MPVIAAYPNSLPSFTPKVDNTDTVFADHINALQAEVAAIAAALGTVPAGTSDTVKQRLTDIEDMHVMIEAHFDSDGNIPQAGVVGLVDAIATLAATVSDTLIDAKGDLLIGLADNTVGRLAVGPNGYVPVADSAAGGGVSWQEVHFAIPFHFANTLTAGLRAPQWIAPKNATLLRGQARANSGANATYQVYVNGASVTATSSVVGTAVVNNDFTDVNINAGDYVQVDIIAPGTAADMSVTIDGVWR